MKKIAKMVGFIEGFLFALLTFMASFGFLASWFNVNLKAVNEAVDENSDL